VVVHPDNGSGQTFVARSDSTLAFGILTG
jgi:hypothetical protein